MGGMWNAPRKGGDTLIGYVYGFNGVSSFIKASKRNYTAVQMRLPDEEKASSVSHSICLRSGRSAVAR